MTHVEKSRKVFFLSWPEAFQAGVEAAGGKGWNMARLDRYGFYIPAGGVLAASAYQILQKKTIYLKTWRKSRGVRLSTTLEKRRLSKNSS
ncbi:MAG TPA: hypothetical protein DCW46_10000 [Desulfotomaculum sp.]|nr:hypothetical protein [Desulfotomaculum sp.]